jgi:hypothetical protein
MVSTAPIKREFPYKAAVRLRDGTRNAVGIVGQGLDFVWIKVSKPTGLQPARTAAPTPIKRPNSKRADKSGNSNDPRLTEPVAVELTAQ